MTTPIPCPCKSGRPFSQCHGAEAPGSSGLEPYFEPDPPPNHMHAAAMQSPGWAGDVAVQVMRGTTYRDKSTVIIIPSRDQFVHHRISECWRTMIHPMNQKCHLMFCHGDEVGHAYNRMVADILAHPELGRWKYVMTMETDNLQPQDAHVRLLETIEQGKYDGVSGLYWTKGEVNMPMAYGDPAKFNQTGELDFAPRDVRSAIGGGHIVEVNGIAMGCSLYRMELFREIPQPWFVTVSDLVEGKGAMGFTQDLWFCKQARMRGKRFAVDCRVLVGHMDLQTGQVF